MARAAVRKKIVPLHAFLCGRTHFIRIFRANGEDSPNPEYENTWDGGVLVQRTATNLIEAAPYAMDYVIMNQSEPIGPIAVGQGRN